MPQHLPLNELAAAVQSAVEQVLGKHGAVPIDKLWVGFVAPENIATSEIAAKLAATLGREAGVTATGSIGTIAGPIAHETAKPPLPHGPGHILGLVYHPKVIKS